MTETIFNDDFVKNYFGKNYIHIEEMDGMGDDTFTYDDFQSLLEMKSHWHPGSLMVMNDTKKVDPGLFFDEVPRASGNDRFILNLEKLEGFIKRGCSVVLNDVHTLNPVLQKFALKLQDMTKAPCQANLYFSMGNNKAFGPHFDDHEVFALHCAGEKVWNIYENVEPYPINADIFQKDLKERMDLSGPLKEKVTLKPGSMLYLPRGQFHDALASGNGSIHIAFGANRMMPLDLLDGVWQRLVQDSWVRSDLPRNPSEKDIKAVLKKLGQKVAELGEDSNLLASIKAYADQTIENHHQINISNLVAGDITYMVSPQIKIAMHQNKPHLTEGKNYVPIPADHVKAITGMMKEKSVTASFFVESFGYAKERAQSLIADMKKLGVLS